MDGMKAALGFLGTRVTESVGLYTAVAGIFFYHVVFDKDFECTSEIQASLCRSYMALPAFMIFFMVLWLDGSFQALLKYSCLKCTRRFCCFLWLWFFRAIFISLLWPISVLIDGDWYVCCWNGTKLLQREPWTPDDKMRLKELKMTSKIIGFGVLLSIVFMAAVLRCVPWKEGCCCCGSNCVNKDVLFDKIVLEEGENLVTNELIEAAKEKINKKLKECVATGEWGKCYDVVDEIIAQPPSHELPSKSSTNDDAVQELTDQPLSDEKLSLLPVPSSTVETTQNLNKYVDAEERRGCSDVGEEIISNFPYYGSVSKSPPNEPTTSV